MGRDLNCRKQNYQKSKIHGSIDDTSKWYIEVRKFGCLLFKSLLRVWEVLGHEFVIVISILLGGRHWGKPVVLRLCAGHDINVCKHPYSCNNNFLTAVN